MLVRAKHTDHHDHAADLGGTTCFFRTFADTTLRPIFPRGMREDPVAMATAWPRPRTEVEKFKLSEVRALARYVTVSST